MLTSENSKKIFTNLLLAFVLVSIGFSLGKHSTTATLADSQAVAANNASARTDDSLVRLYYMHATFRCATCNSVESRAKELIARNFSKALTERKIAWEEVNFQKNEALAKKFDIAASCMVVAQIKNGNIIDFKRLDKVWALIDEPDDFDRYITDAVEHALTSVNGATK